MKPVLTPLEASDLDRQTQARGVPEVDLMERAGRAVARAAIEVAGGVYGRRAVVVCGKGNNGGDGLVAARHLARLGVRVELFSIEARDEFTHSAGENVTRLAEQGLTVRLVSSSDLVRALGRADVAVDAIFGTGFRGRPEGSSAAAIAGLNSSPVPVVAVDIPSGVDGATGGTPGEAVWAVLTVAFGGIKLGTVLLPGAERAGTVRVVDIGFPDDLLRWNVALTEADDIAGILPRRVLRGHKRSSGVLLVVAGSRAMTGAPALIARAACRVGTGLVTVATPHAVVASVGARVAEAIFLPLAQTDEGTVALEGLDQMLVAAERADAVAIGPGLTRQEETAELVRALVGRCAVPLVLDADGLNAFEGQVGRLTRRGGDTVLTPHDGEFARLMRGSVDDVAPDRVAAARSLASESGATTLLKGARTVIAPREGVARVNPTGGVALATAGTGDVLTGVIGGLMARGVGVFDAAAAGAYVHGIAGSLAERELGEGALAGDVIERLPEAIRLVLASHDSERGGSR